MEIFIGSKITIKNYLFKMSISIADFIDQYPPLLPPVGVAGYQDIYSRKEFHDLQASLKNKPSKEYALLSHQEYVQRFMSIHTLYDRLLVFHAVGQGKTHTAAAVCEALLYPPTNNISPYKKAYIFTRNNDLKLAFIKKLVLSATNKKYLPDDGDVENMTSGQLTRKLSGKYQFDTFKAFSNHYGEIPKSYIESAKTSTDYVPVEDAKMLENIHQLYDDSVIVIDEVHNLKRELEVYFITYSIPLKIVKY
jgi:hypothetical protein